MTLKCTSSTSRHRVPRTVLVTVERELSEHLLLVVLLELFLKASNEGEMLRLMTKLNFCLCRGFDTGSNVSNIGSFEKIGIAWLCQPLNHSFNNNVLGAVAPSLRLVIPKCVTM